MDKRLPHRPVLPHLNALLLSLYYLDPPEKILELGLGGGALQRFYQHHFPNCEMTSIEISGEVIEIYKKHFSADGQANIVKEDAQLAISQYLKQDLLVVDLYHEQASPQFLNDQTFYLNCFKALIPDGLLVLNLLPQSELQTQHILSILEELTGHQPRQFSVPEYKNRIIMSSRVGLPKLDDDHKLLTTTKKFGIDLMQVVELS